MTGFSADWLSLRAPFDAAARSAALAAAFVARLPPAPRLVDLGAGTGAARRALDPLIRPRASWTLVDADAALLRVALADRGAGRSTARMRQRGLASDVGALLAGADGATAFAFLDLVSIGWIDRLAAAVAAAGVPFYAPLVVDGRVAWHPRDRDDALIDRLFAAHQRRHKGFGQALGPVAPFAAASALRRRGLRVRLAASDWAIPAGAAAMATALVDGAAAAAAEQAPDEARRIAAWAGRRRAAIAAGALSIHVGHRDLLAWPPCIREWPGRVSR